MYSQDNIVYSSINSKKTHTSIINMNGIRLAQLSDVDMTQATDGAVIVYDGQNFIVTPRIENEHTLILGGGF